MMKIERYYIGSPVEGLCKQRAIWISEGNQHTPLVYLQKPKHIKQEQWAEICNSISISLPSGFEI
jgi:hypothetical protein